VYPTPTTNLSASICTGQSYFFNGINQTTTGTYRDTMTTSNGCDSFLVLSLTVNSFVTYTFNASICNGQSYNFKGIARTSSGVYRDTLKNIANCDSFVILTLTVNPTPTTNVNMAICNGQSYFFNGFNRTTSGTYLDTLVTTNGCDSFIVLSLTVNNSSSNTFNATICNGQSYFFNSTNRTTSGSYLDTLTNSKGCDSFLTLVLTVYPTPTTNLSAAICNGQSYLFNGVYQTTSGTYRDTLVTSKGCDSFIVLTLTVNPTPTANLTASICLGQSYLFNGINQTTSGTYRDTLTTYKGCDSFIVLTLTVNPTPTTNLNIAICNGQSYFFNGVNRNTAGTYRDTLTTSKGCDSFIILNLTVNNSTSYAYNATICNSQFYFFNGSNRTVAGTYLDTLTNIAGCDSFLTLNLVVNPTPTTNLFASICTGQSYLFNGINQTTSGSYRDTLTTTKGCDSFLVLNLTVNNSSTYSFNAFICNGQAYSFRGIPRTSTGIYRDTLKNAMNCDSFVILNLTVHPTPTTNLPVSICTGQSYFFNGLNRTVSGTYLDTLTTIFGCDSFIVLNLTVNNLPTIDAGIDKTRVNCTFDSVQIGTVSVNGMSYRWTPSLGLSDTTIAQPFAKPNATRTYTLEITQNSTGCKNKDSVIVVVTSSTLIANTGGDTTICQNATLSIGGTPTASNGTSPYSYVWTGSSLNNNTISNPNHITSIPGKFSHTLYVTDSKGCNAADTVLITIQANNRITR
jgi:hypothetical protein